MGPTIVARRWWCPGGGFDRNQDPLYPATVSDFGLDVYEVTVGRFRAFVAAGGGTRTGAPAPGAGAHPRIPGSGWDAAWTSLLPTEPVSEQPSLHCNGDFGTWTDEPGDNEALPMNCLTWYHAFAFCAWDGGRLPTDAEWEFAAAGGSEQRVYPWSQPPDATAIDSTYATYACLGDGSAALDCVRADILPVGAHPKGRGRWGHMDQAGSMWEWVLDWYQVKPPVPCIDCASLDEVLPDRVYRGGSFDQTDALLVTSYRYLNSPRTADYTYGVRCARGL